jgi:hypothetical protein
MNKLANWLTIIEIIFYLIAGIFCLIKGLIIFGVALIAISICLIIFYKENLIG